MATVAANGLDPDQQQQTGNTGGGGQVLSSAGSGGAGVTSGGAVGSSATTTQNQAQLAPSVAQYMAANQGAGQQLAGGITNTFQNQANQINQGVTNAQSQLNTQYQPLAQNLNQASAQSSANTAFQNPQDLLNAYQAAQSAQSTNQPLSAQQQQANQQYQQFQNLNTGGYNNAIQNYGAQGQQQNAQLQAQQNTLAQQAQQSVNGLGINNLLQQSVGNPNYNQGQQTLDTLFLQSQPGVQQQLTQNLGTIANQTGQNVSNLNNTTQAQLQALQGLSGQDQAYIQNLFTKGTPGAAAGSGQEGLNQIAADVNSQYNTAQTTGAAQAAAIQAGLQNNKLTSAQLQQLGVAPGTNTWGLTPQQIMSAGSFATNILPTTATAAGLASTANQPEYARYNALNQLAGGPTGSAQQSIFGSAPATQVGSYNPVTFNASNLQNAINTQQQALTGTDFKNALSSVLPYLQPTQGTAGGIGSIAAGGQSGAGIAAQLQAGLANNTLNPTSANTLIQNYIKQQTALENPRFQQQTQAGLNSVFQPFENYYNQQYLPASMSVLGQNPFDANQPTTPGTSGPLNPNQAVRK
jgi:hypothetical protein